MGKKIASIISVSVIILVLACSTGNQPTVASTQQSLEPTTIIQDEPALSPANTPTLSGSVREAPLTPSPTPLDIDSTAQKPVSDFIQGVGRQYPGLLSLPECDSNSQLTKAPLDDSAYSVIIPLGLLTTPQHVLPTSHIYYHLVRDEAPGGGYGPPAVAEVMAPGNIRVLGVNSSESFGGPQGDYRDYDITFAPCQGRMYQLIHVRTLNAELASLFPAGLIDQCDEYGNAQTQYRYCRSTFQLDVPVGTVLGTTGGKISAALDLEAYDLTRPNLAYANLKRFRPDYDLRLKVVCPFDGFTNELRKHQLARIGGYNLQPRTVEPICGEVMQDVIGTAQGNWYAGEPGAQTNWSQELALVHDYVDPTLAAISIGGVVAEVGVWLFQPESAGRINREFSDVIPDGRIYCYQGAITTGGSKAASLFPGRLLISLSNETEMLVEQQDGDCADRAEFIGPTTYLR